MAKIIVNDKSVVNGRVSIRRYKAEINGTVEVLVSGEFATHTYFEEISSLSTPRLSITGIDVIEEKFGSDDYDIYYSFTATDVDITGSYDEELGIVHCLYSEEQEGIEEVMYKDAHPILGLIGAEYSKFITKEEEENE